MINQIINAESLEIMLGELYEKYSYQKYKMNKFEEYAFYLENRNFLGCDSFITFNDRNGRLMALKPDVTLSIVKNTNENRGKHQKLYYNESIFRYQKSDREYKEFKQTGLEYLGEISLVSMAEIITLAVKSLELIDKSFALCLSHMGIIQGLIAKATDDLLVQNMLIKMVCDKNSNQLIEICDENKIDSDIVGKLCGLISAHTKVSGNLDFLSDFAVDAESEKAVDEMKKLCELLCFTPYADNIVIDFSTVSDMRYYNGVMFSGYIENIAAAVVVGGRYDGLLQKLNKGNMQAMGFAINIFEVERLIKQKSGEKKEGLTVILFDNESGNDVVFRTIEKYVDKGIKVFPTNELPDDKNVERIIDVRGKKTFEEGEPI